MRSFAIVMLLANGASGALILDLPAGTDGPSIGQPDSLLWTAQKISLDQPTEITQIDAFVRRRGGTDNPNVALFTDDGGDPGDAGKSIPKDRLFTAELPVPPGNGDFAWRSATGLENWSLDPGTYWIAITSEPKPMFDEFFGNISRTNDPSFELEESTATYGQKDVYDDQGIVIDSFFSWGVSDLDSRLSIRIHGNAVPEPGTALPYFVGVLITGLRPKYHRRRN